MQIADHVVQILLSCSLQRLQLRTFGLLADSIDYDADDQQNDADPQAGVEHCLEVGEEAFFILFQIVLCAPLAFIEVNPKTVWSCVGEVKFYGRSKF